ncbi:hypothetical protein [Corallococcus sp. AS-1-12]|uniref:hypothetical protein n=1 Tax=Corallococcus sp. AS-1-12 TaxID=2874598 RepID=UPI001CBBD0A3|nr:hypothetical protein [Corallococcus sp. AS-1-12]MBZ4334474.1 hypothetical protein [Corallococcus sp. AS-1-12]
MGLLHLEPFEELLIRAGLDEPDELPLHRNPFTPDDAVEVLGRLMEKPVTLGTFPPRMAAGLLLQEVLEQGEVSREELARKVARMAREQLAVLRPDGYLAWALTGRTQQKVAPVVRRDGAFRANGFELGRFYSGKDGVFRAVNARLEASEHLPLAEVYDDSDVINRSVDGAEDAFVDLYHALGHALSRPMDSLAALSNLPTGLAALISSSPAYWERFQYMTEGEQIREVARLTTSIFATWGAASATTRTVTGLSAGVEAAVPVLVLSADGVLALERVVVPVGRAASVLSTGPGAIILQRAGDAAGSGGGSGGGPKGYSSFKSFKRAMGPAGEGKEWHQIVEQTNGNVARFGPQSLHNTENVVSLDKALHNLVSAFFSSKRPFITGSESLTVRQWLSAQTLDAQRAFGLRSIENIKKGIWR